MLYLKCLDTGDGRDLGGHGLEEDAEVVEDSPDEEVVLRTVPHEDEDEAEEGGDDLSQQPVARATYWHVDVSGKQIHLRYVCVTGLGSNMHLYLN